MGSITCAARRAFDDDVWWWPFVVRSGERKKFARILLLLCVRLIIITYAGILSARRTLSNPIFPIIPIASRMHRLKYYKKGEKMTIKKGYETLLQYGSDGAQTGWLYVCILFNPFCITMVFFFFEYTAVEQLSLRLCELKQI